MTSLKEKAADAIIELHSSVMNISDYNEFPSILESILKKMFHIDWLAMFSFNQEFKGYNIVTNPSLPFNWNKKYAEIYDKDVVRKALFNMEIGGIHLHDTVNKPDNEEETYLFETVKKYTDTSHFLAIHTGKTNSFDSAIGFYRTDARNHFVEDDKKIIEYLSPVLVSISHMMMFYDRFDFKRVAIDDLRNNGNALTMTFNEQLIPIDIPRKTKEFLSRVFSLRNSDVIPDHIKNWIDNTIACNGRLKVNTGPWILKMKLRDMELFCKARIVVTAFSRLALLINFIPHGDLHDFSVLTSIGLTKREAETLSYLPLGYSNKQIALAMDIKEVTVKKHLKNASLKLGALGRTELLYQAIRKKTIFDLV